MTVITLIIPEPTPSANQHKWKHWSAHLKLRKHWSMLVMVAKNEARAPNVDPPDRVSVKVTREGRKLLDVDNGIAGCKSLLDSLREQRLILDDSPAHMTLTFEQLQIPRKAYPRTLVEIREI